MSYLVQDWVQRASMKWLTSYRVNALRTRASELLRRRGASKLAFILGCQRSGTTMLAQAIGLSPLVRDYGEGDPKYFRWSGAPRLLSLDEVATRLEDERNRVVLLKPLCESQRAAELLTRFPDSKVVWIHRDYRDCVESHVNYYRQFHDGLSYVGEMLNLELPCWKNENLSPSIRDRLQAASKRSLNMESAYALYWLARNSLVDSIPRDRIMVVKYEDVLGDPDAVLRSVFQFLSIPFRSKYSRIVAAPLYRRHSNPQASIDPDIAQQCRELLSHLTRLSNEDYRAPSALTPDATRITTVRPDLPPTPSGLS